MVDDAGPVWQNADNNFICGTYHDGAVSGTPAPGEYRIICTSFEFATFGTSQTDLDAVMAEYLAAFEGVLPEDESIRGDFDNNGAVNFLVDALFGLNAGFVPGAPLPQCDAAVDANGDRAVSFLVDSLFMLNAGFVPGSPLPSLPYPDCGNDDNGLAVLGCANPNGICNP